MVYILNTIILEFILILQTTKIIQMSWLELSSISNNNNKIPLPVYSPLHRVCLRTCCWRLKNDLTSSRTAVFRRIRITLSDCWKPKAPACRCRIVLARWPRPVRISDSSDTWPWPLADWLPWWTRTGRWRLPLTVRKRCSALDSGVPSRKLWTSLWTEGWECTVCLLCAVLGSMHPEPR